MVDINAVNKTLKQIQQLGVHISIDDFGTGYSSLSHLRSLPVNTLKVDRSFVMNAHLSEEDGQILSAILSMAHSLNLDTVVEGIECEEQQDLLRKQACHEVQGYYYARPMPATDLAALLQSETLSLEPLGYNIDRSILDD